MSIKLARTIRFDHTLSVNEKTMRMETYGDDFLSMSERPGLAFFSIKEQAIYAVAAGALTANDKICDVIRLREKQFEAMEQMMKHAKTDDVIREEIERTYKTSD